MIDKEIILTLLVKDKIINDVVGAMDTVLDPVLKEDILDDDKVFYLTFLDDTKSYFNIIDNKDEVLSQVQGMKKFYTNLIKDENLKEEVRSYLEDVNLLVHFHLQDLSNNERVTVLIDAMFGVSQKLNCLIITPDLTLNLNDGRKVVDRLANSDVTTLN